jgi:hypothetical protein
MKTRVKRCGAYVDLEYAYPELPIATHTLFWISSLSIGIIEKYFKKSA